jgi:hypothetical protein
MKFAAIAVAAMITATSASAAELGATGISIGAELDTFYDFDTEGVGSVVTPEVGYTMMGVSLTASTDLALIEGDKVVAKDMLDAPIVSFGAEYTMGVANLYGEVDVDVTNDFDTSAAKVGVSFKF